MNGFQRDAERREDAVAVDVIRELTNELKAAQERIERNDSSYRALQLHCEMLEADNEQLRAERDAAQANYERVVEERNSSDEYGDHLEAQLAALREAVAPFVAVAQRVIQDRWTYVAIRLERAEGHSRSSYELVRPDEVVSMSAWRQLAAAGKEKGE